VKIINISFLFSEIYQIGHIRENYESLAGNLTGLCRFI